MKEPSITVTFRPFDLTLRRTSGGDFVATLGRVGEQAPLVHSKTAWDSEHGARVRTDTPVPCLQIGTAQFAVPTRQLSRIGDWLAGQQAPVVKAEPSADPFPVAHRDPGEALPDESLAS